MILALDVGGTAVKMGLCLPDGTITARHEASVCFDNYATPMIDTIVGEAQVFVAREGASIEAIGVSATGQADDTVGRITGSDGKIPGYDNTDFRGRLGDVFHVPVHILNDANAAALGECFLGAAKGVKDALMVTIGTGIGGGIVIGGKLYIGAHGLAGEIGHYSLYQNGKLCTCGKRGCYELYAATRALTKKAARRTGERGITGRDIFARAEAGDSEMLDTLDEWISDIAAGITGLVHIFNPEMIIIGGGVCVQDRLLMQPLRERILSGVMPGFREGLRVERAVLGNDAGLLGAMKFCLDCEGK